MGKYIYIYYSGKDDKTSAEDWGTWFGKLGGKLMDPGNPFGEGGQAVSKDGAMDVKVMPATGYSIVEAKDMAEAVTIAKDCPLMGAENGAVCVYEALPM